MPEPALPGGMPPASRDLVGYGPSPPDPRWPGGARVAVSIVVNVEEGAEFALSSGDGRNEANPETGLVTQGAADPCTESHFDYGGRVGLWRVLDQFDAFGVKATFSACGRAVAASPHLATASAARGHEVSAHGWRWEAHAGMEEAAERLVISRTVATLAEHAGARPLGWHTKGAPSANTRRLLMEEGGFLYDSDCYDDDLPRILAGPSGPHVILPYAFDTNDMRFRTGQGFAFAEDFSRYCIAAFDRLVREGGRMMSVGLHLRTIGRPGRIAGLEQFLAHVAAAGDRAWVAPRRDIARHWLSHFG